MKKIVRFWFFCTFVCFFQVCMADTSDILEGLYFVSGSPRLDFYSTAPTVLYSLNSERKELSRLRAITSFKQGAEFVRPYYDEGLLLVGSLIEPKYYRLDVVHFRDPKKKRSIEVGFCESCNVLRSYLLNREDSLDYIFMLGDRVDEKLTISFKSVNLLSASIEDSSWVDFGEITSYGASGGNVAGDDILPFIFSDSGKAVFGHADRVALNWEFPPDLELKETEYVFQISNNERFRLIKVNKEYKSSQGTPESSFYSFDKEQQRWESFKLDGNRLRVRVFGEWLASEKAFHGFKRKQDLADYDQQVAEALGRRGSAVDRSGEFLRRLSERNVNQQGVLMMRNLRSGLYIELKALSEDAEILLIKNGKVVYRDGSQIKIAEIKHDRIQKNELIVDDERARSIHWAFSKSHSHR